VGEDSLLPEVRMISNRAHGDRDLPSREVFYSKRVVIATCATAAKLESTVGLTNDFFTHIFIDEASQCDETTITLPLLFQGPKTQVVIAGDPMQLGPVIMSPIAAGRGLATSLMERLILSPPYYRQPLAGFQSGDDSEEIWGGGSRGGGEGGGGGGGGGGGVGVGENRNLATRTMFDPRFVTKLVDTYRSHPDILQVPNELFYGGDLVCLAPEEETHTLVNWRGLPTKGFPITFISIAGQEEREGNSPSWFNQMEALSVFDCAFRLVSEGEAKPCEVCIIAPCEIKPHVLYLFILLLNATNVIEFIISFLFA